jgi:hypothetical protein
MNCFTFSGENAGKHGNLMSPEMIWLPTELFDMEVEVRPIRSRANRWTPLEAKTFRWSLMPL